MRQPECAGSSKLLAYAVLIKSWSDPIVFRLIGTRRCALIKLQRLTHHDYIAMTFLNMPVHDVFIVIPYCFLSLFHVVTWVRCGAWLYRFMIFSFFLSFFYTVPSVTCSHLLGKRFPLCFPVCDVSLCFCNFPIWCHGQKSTWLYQILIFAFFFTCFKRLTQTTLLYCSTIEDVSGKDFIAYRCLVSFLCALGNSWLLN